MVQSAGERIELRACRPRNGKLKAPVCGARAAAAAFERVSEAMAQLAELLPLQLVERQVCMFILFFSVLWVLPFPFVLFVITCSNCNDEWTVFISFLFRFLSFFFIFYVF